MTTTTEMTDSTSSKPETADSKPSPLRATPSEIKAYAGIGAIAALWIGATVLFGFGGLIIGALIAVAVVFLLMVIISRG